MTYFKLPKIGITKIGVNLEKQKNKFFSSVFMRMKELYNSNFLSSEEKAKAIKYLKSLINEYGSLKYSTETKFSLEVLIDKKNKNVIPLPKSKLTFLNYYKPFTSRINYNYDYYLKLDYTKLSPKDLYRTYRELEQVIKSQINWRLPHDNNSLYLTMLKTQLYQLENLKQSKFSKLEDYFLKLGGYFYENFEYIYENQFIVKNRILSVRNEILTQNCGVVNLTWNDLIKLIKKKHPTESIKKALTKKAHSNSYGQDLSYFPLLNT